MLAAFCSVLGFALLLAELQAASVFLEMIGELFDGAFL
jgi:hypothetical protein